jgi:DNA polymerase-3 subunit epsilon
MYPSSRRFAILQAREFLRMNPVYLDTETTGLHLTAEVIQIGIIDDQENVLFEALSKPRGKIDPAAARIHGITVEMLEKAQRWEQVWPLAQAALQDRKVGVYNVEFDVRVIKQSNRYAGLPPVIPEANFFDVMKLYAEFHGDRDPYRRSFRFQSLEMAGRQCGISLPNAHDAVADCLLTRALLHYMAEST